MKYLKVKNKKYKLPIFCPDATKAVVRSVDARDLVDVGIDGVCVNTLHLLSDPGAAVLKKFGGVRNFMDFPGLIISDSGGFQVFSLIYGRNEKSEAVPREAQRAKWGKLTDDGAIFYTGGMKKPIKHLLTPEKSIQMQFAIGADVMVCLDDCPSSNVSEKENKLSVERTVAWARRCKAEFEKQINLRHLKSDSRPLIIGVVQGGDSKKLRKYCLQELLKIGFDGFGMGGWVPNAGNPLQVELIKWLAGIIPEKYYKYGLGIGKLQDLIVFTKAGYEIYDCVLPTRDARHQRLYEIKKPLKNLMGAKNPKSFFNYLYINKQKHQKENKPISKYCDCLVCKNYSRAYLNHLFKLNEPLAMRLATIHNLRVYAKVIEVLRKEV